MAGISCQMFVSKDVFYRKITSFLFELSKVVICNSNTIICNPKVYLSKDKRLNPYIGGGIGIEFPISSHSDNNFL